MPQKRKRGKIYRKKTPPKAFYAEGGAFFFNFVNSYLLLSIFTVQRMESRSEGILFFLNFVAVIPVLCEKNSEK